MYRTDDPLSDFDRWDREQTEWLEKRPECADCGHPVQDDFYYLINGEVICQDCLESNYRREIEDF